MVEWVQHLSNCMSLGFSPSFVEGGSHTWWEACVPYIDSVTRPYGDQIMLMVNIQYPIVQKTAICVLWCSTGNLAA
ncbi:hypothetical protein XELAEV_18013158mg [Xenopus laevis]|uniref:Uncharacterized protein n=1 Tax=Xenopus laevis TaxID=8355 RepID=A0A974DQD2_XENLA|nr:hypothetical protein XELAEV_18013158mg [Xenopus laevis]